MPFRSTVAPLLFVLGLVGAGALALAIVLATLTGAPQATHDLLLRLVLADIVVTFIGATAAD